MLNSGLVFKSLQYCALLSPTVLSVCFEEVINERKSDADDNFKYFVSELLNIPAVKEEILNQLKLKT